MNTRSLIIALSASIALFSSTMQARAQGPAPPAPVVEVVSVELTPIAPQRWVPGSVVSRDDARLATSASGRLEFVAEVGTRLKAGELVAQLEDQAAKLRLEDAQSEVARIKAQGELARRQRERLKALVSSNSIAANQLDEAEAQVAQLDAQLRQAEVRVRSARYDLKQTRVVAPFPGIVTERLAQRGEFAATGTAIVHLVNVTNLEASVQAPLAMSALVKPGMELSVRDGDKTYKERIRAVIAVGDDRSRQFEIRIAMTSPVLVGNAVEVALPEREAENTLAVPRDALVERPNGTYVVRVSDDGSSERIEVTIGASDGFFTAVDGDLSAGDRIVVRGAERLGDGQKVRVASSSGGASSPTAASAR
ncbi:efflux RND transporter periplasmic adaptor subunit [Dokdonella sp.]|uniref:efflux RND transporter periplasmic adaptor subunit n=1 Tax=Dokdonella sp. TaxID=2291710 RepID=UPI0035283CC8